jgi:hypothetical protein
MRYLLAPLVAAVLLAGCGDSKPSATVALPGTTVPMTVTQPAPQPAAAAVPGLFDMPTLEAAVVEAYNTTPPYTDMAASARCRLTGPTTARCAVIAANGAVARERITIASDGSSWSGRPVSTSVTPSRRARERRPKR